MSHEKIKVVIAQLGSPRSTKVSDVRAYLKEFLGDQRVVDLPRFLWWIILNFFVLPFRPKKSAQAYSRIYQKDGFPLVTITQKVALALAPHLDSNLEINHGFLLSSPRVGDLLDQWEKEDIFTRAQKVYILPQFPQYAESTIGSVVDTLGKDLAKRVNIPHLNFVSHYHRSKVFIDHSVRMIHESLKGKQIDVLIISFHGIPLRRVTQKKDDYFQHCVETFELIKQRLNLDLKIEMTFQSRFGSEKWLGPYTDKTTCEFVKQGHKNIAVYCPSFVVDCLETIDEIGHELGQEVSHLGGQLQLISCLNDDPIWIKAYAGFINTLVNGNRKDREDLYYEGDIKNIFQEKLTLQKIQEVEPLDTKQKTTLKIMFVTMFLDLMGFSLIFPMFPQIAKYYLETNPNDPILNIMLGVLGKVQSYGPESMNSIVLFGGLLGALYSFLQFVAAPLWGGISDKVGRRPVMLISVTGMVISYLIWVVSSSFTLLVLARIVGGIMAGNLSIASAVVSDVTSDKQRSKGMAVIGIAFALGFIFGPAIGGISALYDITKSYPQLIDWGFNPFSFAAMVAMTLSLINLIFIFRSFPETLKKGDTSNSYKKTINPLKLFKPLNSKGVNLTNISYFIFIAAFSGMEFTLTFLAVERLAYSSLQNAYMFIFIGVIIALVQGGYVRRKAYDIGEKKMSLQGLALIIPGLLLLAYAHNSLLLYFGLFFLATGSAMVIPCLTTLVSLFSPKNMQGLSLGVFRSLGSLGRVIGPLYAALIYWRFGAMSAYTTGAVLVLIPLFLISQLPQHEEVK